VNFTREPIIETIISPKDGYKLCVRNSRGSSSEEFFVDAIEVVSFGRAFFFRSLERPKAFIVPVTDYEVLEVKETRVALKNVAHDRNIKIGGGREAPVRVQKEIVVEKTEELIPLQEDLAKALPEEPQVDQSADSRIDKKRDRRRHRRRRLAEERREWIEKEKQDQPSDASSSEISLENNSEEVQETIIKPPVMNFSTLIPPPSTLISETISRYKDKEGLEGVFFTKNSSKEEVKVEENNELQEKDENFFDHEDNSVTEVDSQIQIESEE
jgi:hypothetical protein